MWGDLGFCIRGFCPTVEMFGTFDPSKFHGCPDLIIPGRLHQTNHLPKECHKTDQFTVAQSNIYGLNLGVYVYIFIYVYIYTYIYIFKFIYLFMHSFAVKFPSKSPIQVPWNDPFCIQKPQGSQQSRWQVSWVNNRSATELRPNSHQQLEIYWFYFTKCRS